MNVADQIQTVYTELDDLRNRLRVLEERRISEDALQRAHGVLDALGVDTKELDKDEHYYLGGHKAYRYFSVAERIVLLANREQP